MNIIIAIATLWITTSVAATKHLYPNKFSYDPLGSYTAALSAKTTEKITDDSGESYSVRRTAVPETLVSSVTTHAAAGPSALPSGANSLSPKSLSPTPATLNALEIQELSRILEQTTKIFNSPKATQVTEETTVPETGATLVENSTFNGSSTDNMLTNATSGSMTSPPDVILSTKGTKTYIDDMFKQSLAWLGDTYTLSIIIPILAGFLFAMAIIITLVTFACIRRRCRRRRLRRKILPDTIRKMGPSDRARLLAETSDEEF